MIEKREFYMPGDVRPFMSVACDGVRECPVFSLARELGVKWTPVTEGEARHVLFDDNPNLHMETIATCFANACRRCRQNVR